MINSNVNFKNYPYTAAYMVQGDKVSMFTTGKDAVDSLLNSAKGTDATVYCFFDEEYALQEYTRDINMIHSGKNRYADDMAEWEDYEKENRNVWYRGVDGGLYEDFEQSIGE
jgi:hypothetical protein